MLNLDAHINNRIEVKLFGDTLTIKEPTVEMSTRVNQIEKDVNSENFSEKRLRIAVLFLNNNEEGLIFNESELKNLPMAVITTVVNAVIGMKDQADTDPNLESQSQTEK